MIAVIAIVMGIAASAFTNQPTVKQNDNAMHYIQFTGTDNSNGQIQAPGNWSDLGTGTPTLTCDKTTGVVCFVKFDGDLSSYQSYVSNKTIANLQSAGIIQEYRQP